MSIVLLLAMGLGGIHNPQLRTPEQAGADQRRKELNSVDEIVEGFKKLDEELVRELESTKKSIKRCQELASTFRAKGDEKTALKYEELSKILKEIVERNSSPGTIPPIHKIEKK